MGLREVTGPLPPPAQWWQIASALATCVMAPVMGWLTWSKLRSERQLQRPVFELHWRGRKDEPWSEIGLTVRNRGRDLVSVRRLTIVKPPGVGFRTSLTESASTLAVRMQVEPGETEETWRRVTGALSDPRRKVRVEYVLGTSATKVRAVTVSTRTD